MKRWMLGCSLAALATCGMAQSLDKMQWFNEPQEWKVKKDLLEMSVTPKTDYWRVSHYGFTGDDAPFLYTLRGGEFEVKVKISGDYRNRFDQSGLMLRIDHENYIKAGIEYVDGKYNLSTVVTHRTSDWSIIPLDRPVPFVWIKAVRKLDAVEVSLLLRRPRIHTDAQCLDAGQLSDDGRCHGSLSRRRRIQGTLQHLPLPTCPMPGGWNGWSAIRKNNKGMPDSRFPQFSSNPRS